MMDFIYESFDTVITASVAVSTVVGLWHILYAIWAEVLFITGFSVMWKKKYIFQARIHLFRPVIKERLFLGIGYIVVALLLVSSFRDLSWMTR